MVDEIKCVCLPYGEPADLCMCRPRAGSQILMAEQNVQFAKEDAEDALRRLARAEEWLQSLKDNPPVQSRKA